MPKIFHILLQIAFAVIVGAALWSLVAYLLVYSVSYGTGRVPVDIFGAGFMDGRIFVWIGLIWGAAQGFFIGLVNGCLDVDRFFKGGLFGFITTVASVFLLLIAVNLNLIFNGNRSLSYKLGELLSDIPGFIFLIILMFIPSFIIGAVGVKAFALLTRGG